MSYPFRCPWMSTSLRMFKMSSFLQNYQHFDHLTLLRGNLKRAVEFCVNSLFIYITEYLFIFNKKGPNQICIGVYRYIYLFRTSHEAEQIIKTNYFLQPQHSPSQFLPQSCPSEQTMTSVHERSRKVDQSKDY